MASGLREVPLAHQGRSVLLPYADQAVTLAVLPMPAVVHHLGLTAATVGSYDEADEWFRKAEAMHERMAASAWLARTRIEWAATLLRRGGSGDATHARGLLSEALAPAVEFAWPGLERRARRLLGEVGS